jgi:predicted nucleic acid-binding protein
LTLLVVDASVAAKWFLPAADEPYSAEASQLLARYAADEIRLLVPDLFWAEIANILWKAVRIGRCTKVHAEATLLSLQDSPLPSAPSLPLLDLAFSIATAFDRSVYDSLYVALAVHSKAQLVTADERLANALAAHFPVKHLASI